MHRLIGVLLIHKFLNSAALYLTPTLLADNARLLTLSIEIRLAGSLVGKTLGKFKQLHLAVEFKI